MNENEMMQDDEISLFDLWEKLQDGWRFVAGAALLGIVGSVLAVFLISPKFEALTTFQIGKVAGNVIESPETTVARIATPAFRLEVARKLGDEKLVEQLTVNASAVNVLATSSVKGTSLLSLTASGSTPDSARKLGEIVIESLQQRHETIGLSLKDKILSDITANKEKLMIVEKELDNLTKAVSGTSSFKDAQFAPASLLTSMRMQKQAEVFATRQALSGMELSLLPPATQPTEALERLYVADKPVSPKKGLLLALGLIGGLLVGVVAVFFVDAWRRAKRERAARV